MRVLIVSTNADEAGAPRHVETLVNGLSSVCEFILVFGEHGPVSARLKQQGHEVHVIKTMRSDISPLLDLVSLFMVSLLVLRCNPDLVHCHSMKAGVIGRIAACLFGKKWIYTVHGWGWRGKSRSMRLAFVLLEKFLALLPRGHFIFVSRVVMEDGKFFLGLKPGRGTVIHNGVPDVSPVLESHISSLRIIMPARVCSAKDHITLVSAFEKFNDPNSELILCGSGTDAPDFIARMQRYAQSSFSRISFLGQRSDIASLYARSSVVALISFFEAFPLSIVEAMCCSRPVIASVVGGVPDIVEDGSSGFLVGLECVDDIVAAFVRYRSQSLRRLHGERGRCIYSSRFTVDRMLDLVRDLYFNVQL